MNDEQREASKPSKGLAGLFLDGALFVSSAVFGGLLAALADASNYPWLVGAVISAGLATALSAFAAQRDGIESLKQAIKRIVVKIKPSAAGELAISLTYLRHLKQTALL